MKIALAQINARIGDFRGNSQRIVDAARRATSLGAELVVFPELVVPGIAPRDLLCDPRFVDATRTATERLAADLADTAPVLLGTVQPAPYATPRHPSLLNVAALLHGGRIVASVGKRLLPAGDVFHEARWFVPSDQIGVVTIAGRRIGVLICEDLWSEGYRNDPVARAREHGIDLFVCLSASPYRCGIAAQRIHHAARTQRITVYVNTVGAHDEVIYDGGSFIVGPDGLPVAQLARFREEIAVVDTDSIAREPLARMDPTGELAEALTLGVRDFVGKNALRNAFVGLSGGIDSSVVACIASDALGPSRVTGVAIPSRFSDPRSLECAEALARSLGIGFETVPLEPLHECAERTLGTLIKGAPEDSAMMENVQARLRAMILMAYVNRRGGILLNTSNKTELTLGYGTLYGDMAGALGVLADLTKPQVYDLARWFNRTRPTVPAFAIDRPPSAELRPGQTDPFDYASLAPQLESAVQRDARGEPLSRALADLVRRAEHKRWQFGVGLKVTECAFGSGRLVPISSRWC